MSTKYEDGKFIADVLSETLLEDAMKWIGEHMAPEEVFDDSKLSEWAYNNDFERKE